MSQVPTGPCIRCVYNQYLLSLTLRAIRSKIDGFEKRQFKNPRATINLMHNCIGMIHWSVFTAICYIYEVIDHHTFLPAIFFLTAACVCILRGATFEVTRVLYIDKQVLECNSRIRHGMNENSLGKASNMGCKNIRENSKRSCTKMNSSYFCGTDLNS